MQICIFHAVINYRSTVSSVMIHAMDQSMKCADICGSVSFSGGGDAWLHNTQNKEEVTKVNRGM